MSVKVRSGQVCFGVVGNPMDGVTCKISVSDCYYAGRLASGRLVIGVENIADPGIIPVVVLRYLVLGNKKRDGMPPTRDVFAIYHEDLERVEIRNELFSLDSDVGRDVLMILGLYPPNDNPDPSILWSDVAILRLQMEMDTKILNDIRLAQDPHAELLEEVPGECIYFSSVVKNHSLAGL